jgi:hypothetical protein
MSDSRTGSLEQDAVVMLHTEDYYQGRSEWVEDNPERSAWRN